MHAKPGQGHCVGPDSENNYQRQGHWEFFHPNGQKQAEGSYVDGFQGGQTDIAGILIDGREGAWMLWYENGQKWTESTYLNGELEGL
jgi:antitoxin component YwqK of YwqJK toxin-antitoxin module